MTKSARRKRVKNRRSQPMPAVVALNAAGRRIGEGHPRAVLSDHEVDLVLELLDDRALSQQQVADIMEISRRSVRDIGTGRRRAQIPAAWVPRDSTRR